MPSKKRFKPNTTVAAIIHCHGKFLFVEEYEENKKVLNQPAGHIEAGENLVSACKREVYEETGLVLSPDYVSGIYYFHREDINLYYLRICFVIELETQSTSLPIDNDILTTRWLSYDELCLQQSNLRSQLVLECIDDYIEHKRNGHKIPLSSLKSNL